MLADLWRNPDSFSLAVAVAMALVVLAARRFAAAPWIVGAAVFALVAGVAAVSTQFDLVGWHGFMHASPMLRIFDGAPLPPEDPVYAGSALRYPWIGHWLLATVGRLTGVAPSVVGVAFELAMFALLLVAAAMLARRVTRDFDVVALAVLLTAFGVSVAHEGAVQDALQRAFPWLSLETRIVPLDKFANLNAMPAGYAAMLVSAVVTLSAATGRVAALPAAFGIGASTLAAALFHPLSWLGLLVFQGTAACVLFVSRSGDRRLSAAIVAATAAASLATLPYLLPIGASDSSDGWSGLTPPGWLLSVKAADLAIFLLPFTLAAYLQRRDLAARIRSGDRATSILLASVVAMGAAYLAVRMPGRNEYKFLLFATPAAAVVVAMGLAKTFRAHAALATLLVVAFVVPGARTLGWRPAFRVTDPVTLDGPYLRLRDREADELYRWIAASTPQDAVFLAADLRIPPLARRTLYVAVDAPWKGRDGWGLTRTQLLQWHVRHPDREMYRRQHLATLALDAEFSRESAASVVARIAADVPGRPLFLHVNAMGPEVRLDRTPIFTLRFRNAAGSVYAIDTDAAAGSANAAAAARPAGTAGEAQ